MKNNFIALLVFVLIAASIVVFLFNSRSVIFITGLASSGSSSASFNLTEEVSVLVTGSVNFGSGRVNPNVSYAILDSEGGYLYNWTNLTPTGSKPKKMFGTLVYFEAIDAFILAGNDGIASDTNDTWMFNYSDKQWTNITKALTPGSFNSDPTMVYDSLAQAVILFGSGSGNTETWKLNTARNWQNLSPTGDIPTSYVKSMAFDSKRNITVLISADSQNVTWEYNSSANEWKKISNTNGTSRAYPGMAFDSDRNVTVLFGGNRAGSGYMNDTWEYNGTVWVNVTNRISGNPGKREVPRAMVYDKLRKKIILFGGYYNNVYYDDVWEYNGTAWTNVTLTSMPNPGYFSAAFYPKINKTIGASGYYLTVQYDMVYPNETWEYEPAAGFNTSLGCINGTWVFERGYINVENDGTANISVNFTADKNAAQFVGGTSPSFQIKGVADEANACPDLSTTYAEVPNSTETPNVLCPILKYQNDADTFKIPVRLVVPSDVAAGEKNSTITFSATKSGSGPA